MPNQSRNWRASDEGLRDSGSSTHGRMLESALRRRIEGAGPDASLSNGKALEDVQRDLAVERDIWNTDKSPGANDRFSKQLERIENGFRVAVTKKTTTKRHAGSESANVGAANTERAAATEVP